MENNINELNNLIKKREINLLDNNDKINNLEINLKNLSILNENLTKDK